MMDAPEIGDEVVTLRPERAKGGFDGYSVWAASERVGSVAVRQESRSAWSIRWNVGTDEDASFRLALHTVGVITDYVLGELGAGRVEARIPVSRTIDVRAASICGLRREGVLRGAGDEPDRVLMARLATDPPARSRDGFIAILNAGLPTKRVIAQGLWRDTAGRVLLCELTYKNEWDLPGGVIEVGESPALGLQREIREELGIDLEVGDLVTVSWQPAWRGWDDACIFLFDLGVSEADVTERMTLQATEIADVHWCDEALVREHATAAATQVLDAVTAGVAPYREAERAPEE